MKCDKKNCGLEGQIVYCMDYPNYPYKKCPYYKMSSEIKYIGAMFELREAQLNTRVSE